MKYLYDQACTIPLDEVTTLLSRCLGPRPSFVLSSGYGVYCARLPLEFIDTSGNTLDKVTIVSSSNSALETIGVSVAKGGCGANTVVLSEASLAIRIGLLSRMLKRAQDHLSNRRTQGRTTSSHQLIVVTFAEIYGWIDIWRGMLALPTSSVSEVYLRRAHREVTLLTNKAEKLMGGHGYLMNGIHVMSHFSTILYSIYGE